MAANFDVLFSTIHKKCYDLNPTTPMVIKGMQWPNNQDEFVVFNDLGLYGMRSRKSDINQMCFIEIICYSKHANEREDNRIRRAWELAQGYYDLFHQARFVVENTCLQLHEARLMALDLRSLGDFAQNINQQSPTLNLDAVVMEVDGTIIQSKD